MLSANFTFRLPSPTAQTHAPYHLRPWTDAENRGERESDANVSASECVRREKVIVVSRNPYDACVSMYHHSRDIPSFEVLNFEN